MSAIGILGGMGPQASVRLYDLLIKGTGNYTSVAVDSDYPEIVLFNVPVPNFILDDKKMLDAKRMLINRTKLLEKAGCVINGIACNTAHILLPELQAATKVPFISIPQLVSQKIKEENLQKVGLLATPTTLSSRLYDEAIGKNVLLIRPGELIAKKVEEYIYKLLDNSLSEEERGQFTFMVDRFANENKLEAVILGCTELPLIYAQPNNERVIDTLQLLADALLENYFSLKLRYNRDNNE